MDLFRKAEPLLRQKRSRGWTATEVWNILVEHWLADAGVPVDTKVHKKQRAVSRKLQALRREEPDVVNLVHDACASEKQRIVDMLRFTESPAGRKAAFDFMNDEHSDCSHSDEAAPSAVTKMRLAAHRQVWLEQVCLMHSTMNTITYAHADALSHDVLPACTQP